MTKEALHPTRTRKRCLCAVMTYLAFHGQSSHAQADVSHGAKAGELLVASSGCLAPRLNFSRWLMDSQNAMLVAPDVDVDVFRTQIARMGTNRPKFLLFVSQDDGALKASRFIGGDVQRLGDVNPAAEPYRGEFERSGIEVFDLTKLGGGDAHGRAFEEVNSVVGMIKHRMNQGQALATPSSTLDSQIEQIANAGR